MKDSRECKTEDHSETRALDDPLGFHDKPDATLVRLARALLHPDVERLYRRITANELADATEVRVLLLAHLVYGAYRDLKETIAL